MSIVSSSFTEDAPEVDGRRWVRERHVLSDGRVLTFDWLGDQAASPVLAARVATLSRQLDDEAAALAATQGTRLPLFKLQFRRLFTRPEREAIDEFEMTFETNPGLTVEQKRAIRTFFKDYSEASEIRLDDPDTVAGVQLFASLGLISTERAAEVLAHG